MLVKVVMSFRCLNGDLCYVMYQKPISCRMVETLDGTRLLAKLLGTREVYNSFRDHQLRRGVGILSKPFRFELGHSFGSLREQ